VLASASGWSHGTRVALSAISMETIVRPRPTCTGATSNGCTARAATSHPPSSKRRTRTASTSPPTRWKPNNPSLHQTQSGSTEAAAVDPPSCARRALTHASYALNTTGCRSGSRRGPRRDRYPSPTLHSAARSLDHRMPAHHLSYERLDGVVDSGHAALLLARLALFAP
jgi:hypothetical protein